MAPRDHGRRQETLAAPREQFERADPLSLPIHDLQTVQTHSTAGVGETVRSWSRSRYSVPSKSIDACNVYGRFRISKMGFPPRSEELSDARFDRMTQMHKKGPDAYRLDLDRWAMARGISYRLRRPSFSS